MQITLDLMIKRQIIGRGISDQSVIRAFYEIDRKLFVPEKFIQYAYDDSPLAIAENQTISQPYMVAIMTQMLKIKEEDSILEIGTGSGYQTAILAALADRVVSIEFRDRLSEFAAANLTRLPKKISEKIILRIGDGSLGCIEFAPFDKIVITAAAPAIPKPLFAQLNAGGLILAPVGDKFSQTLELWTITNEGKQKLIERNCGCRFVPLIGDYGWN